VEEINMTAKKRPSPITDQIVYRVYLLPEELRSRIQQKRTQYEWTLREYLCEALTHELPKIEQELQVLGLETPRQTRAARLPLANERLLKQLQDASEVTGVPASRLLLACLSRFTKRKRRPQKRLCDQQTVSANEADSDPA